MDDLFKLLDTPSRQQQLKRSVSAGAREGQCLRSDMEFYELLGEERVCDLVMAN